MKIKSKTAIPTTRSPFIRDSEMRRTTRLPDSMDLSLPLESTCSQSEKTNTSSSFDEDRDEANFSDEAELFLASGSFGEADEFTGFVVS